MNKTFSIQKLTNSELHQTLQNLARQEREILSQVLEHIAEVDRRRLYLEMAYPSLFEYLTSHLQYSAGSAQRRIDAARLLKDVPDLTGKLEAGQVNLSQISLVQKTIRQKKVQVSRAEKQQLIQALEGKTFPDSQVLVAQALNIEIQEAPKVNFQKDESVRLEITFSKQQWEKLQQMRELLSHSLPNGSWAEVFEQLADKVIRQKTKTSNQVSAAIRKAVLRKDSCCQYRDPLTNKQCTSKWQLQIDHIQPRWAQGGNEPSNLRVLCGKHNRHIYRKQAGLA